MKAFPGFPGGRIRVTPVPDLFFSSVLPAIDDLAELKVTLHVLWSVSRRKDALPGVSRSELEADATLAESLAAVGEETPLALEDGLERAVRRGTLLRVTASEGDQPDQYLFLNSQRGREAVDRIARGLEQLRPQVSLTEPPAPAERPNIFELYEQNVGLLQPIIADELREAEKQYPAAWVEEAFRIAARSNARNWRYIRSILDRWSREGKT